LIENPIFNSLFLSAYRNCLLK